MICFYSGHLILFVISDVPDATVALARANFIVVQWGVTLVHWDRL